MTNSESLDDLFASISDLLSTGAGKESAEPTSSIGIIQHPWLCVDDDGVPVIIGEIFASFMPSDLFAAMSDEARSARADIMDYLSSDLLGGNLHRRTSGKIAKAITGRDPETGEELARFLARLVMVAALMAQIATLKSLGPDGTGMFVSPSSLSLANHANAIAKAAYALGGPVRAEWVSTKGGDS